MCVRAFVRVYACVCVCVRACVSVLMHVCVGVHLSAGNMC